MRMLTVFLLILVVFFGGMMYGSYEKDQYTLGLPNEKGIGEQVESEVMQVDPYHTETIEPEPPVNMEKEVPFIHQVASFCERIFVSTYELFLRIMYSIAELFY